MVYLAMTGGYDDPRVCHVFSHKEDAESYLIADRIETFDVRNNPVEVRYWHHLGWRPGVPVQAGGGGFSGNPHLSAELRDFDGDPLAVVHGWSTNGAYLEVEGWDRQLVQQIYLEQRNEHIVRELGQ